MGKLCCDSASSEPCACVALTELTPEIEIPSPDDERILRHVALGDTGYRLLTWSTGSRFQTGQEVIGYVFGTAATPRLFVGEDCGVAPADPIDSDRALRGLLSFLLLKPGDTDSEHFDRYTPEQRAFAESSAIDDLFWWSDWEPDDEDQLAAFQDLQGGWFEAFGEEIVTCPQCGGKGTVKRLVVGPVAAERQASPGGPIDTFEAVRQAPDRYRAAHAIRAHATEQAALLWLTCSPLRLLAQIVKANGYADQLERDYRAEDSSDLSEPPWRDWLREWGYV